MYGSRAPQGAQYYCRGCGEKRQLEQEKFLVWLARQKCPACGATLKQDLKHGRREASPAAPESPGSGRRAA
jgi:ribosomal protein L37AE/L43A